jgi:putative two-component system response regulator
MAIQARILIVDASNASRELIESQLLDESYEIDTASDGEAALRKIRSAPPDIVLIDLILPRVPGHDVVRIIKSDPETQLTPVVILQNRNELADSLDAIRLGADDFIVKPTHRAELVSRVRSLLRRRRGYVDVEETDNILFSLATALDSRDHYARGAMERVAHDAMELATALGLRDQEVEHIRRGAVLHDIGNIGLPDGLLAKPGRLTEEEWKIVKTHTLLGFEICRSLVSIEPALSCIRNHHERVDGTGFPDGLEGDEIPLKAMVVAIADSYDAMVSDRPHRRGRSHLEAVQVFERERDSGQWAPEIVDVFLDVKKRDLFEPRD